MRRLITFVFLSIPTFTFGQFGVDFHMSNLPFFGLSYEIKDRVRPEIRIATDTYFNDFSIEGVVTYDILNKPDYEIYAGLGIRSNDFAGLVIPVGFNFYPFTEKKFGFLIELAPIIGESDILRGSLGFRYKFVPDNE